MNNDYFNRLEKIFHKALEINDEKRLEFLKNECQDESSMFDELCSMLRLDSQEDSLSDNLTIDVQAIIHKDPLIDQLISHYHILEKIGKGGMGEVYLAEDCKLKRKVAIKFLPIAQNANTDLRQRFIREAHASAKLVHPNIITIHEISEHDNRIFMVLEYIKGAELRHYITNKNFDIPKSIDIIIQVCSSLEKAHEAGIVHRDIKPENILIENSDHVKLLDFGVSKSLTETSLTRAGALIGTPYYMSPEQILGKDIDFRADIYSVGVLLYELITGITPFAGDRLETIIQAILNNKARTLAEFNNAASTQLQLIVDKALEKETSLRYQTIKEFKDDLVKYSEGTSTKKIYYNDTKPKIPSLAVLYIQNLGAESDEFLSFGITEDLIVDLSRLSKINISPMRSILKYKDEANLNLTEIARTLEVEYILDGSIYRAEDNIRISAQLIDASSNKVLWADRWQEAKDQLPHIKESLVAGIGNALNFNKPQLEKANIGTLDAENSDAYEFYLRGKYLFDRRKNTTDIGIAVGMYNKALTLEPSMMIAKAGLTEILMQQGNYDVALSNLQSMLKDESIVSRKPLLATVHLLLAKYYLQHSEWQLAEDHAHQGIELSIEINDLSGEVRILGVLVSILLPQAKFDQALSHFDKILEINRHFVDQDKIGEALKNIGNIHRQKGEYKQAKNYHKEALALARKQENLVLEAACLGNLGNINLFQNEFDKALKNYQDALEINSKLGEQKIIQGLLSNIAHIWDLKGQYHKAINALEKATLISRQLNDDRIYIHILSSLCDVYIKLGKFDNALEKAELVLQFALKINYKAGISSAYQCLGNSYFWKKDYSTSFMNFNKSIEIAETAKLPRSEAWINLLLAECYYFLEKYDQAEMSFIKAKEVSETIGEKTVSGLTSIYLKTLQVIIYKSDDLSHLTQKYQKYQKLKHAPEYAIVRRLYGTVLYKYSNKNEENTHGLTILQDALSSATEIGNIPEAIRLNRILRK